MILEHKQSSDAYLRRMFSWLTRIGAAPKFGTRPIMWYQIHQCKAIDWLEANIADKTPLRCYNGMIQHKYNGRWINTIPPNMLFDIADKASRV